MTNLTFPRGESDLTADDKVAFAESNHIWVNAMSCVTPTDDLYRSVGKMIIDKLNESPIHGEALGVKIGKVLYVRLNKS